MKNIKDFNKRKNFKVVRIETESSDKDAYPD